MKTKRKRLFRRGNKYNVSINTDAMFNIVRSTTSRTKTWSEYLCHILHHACFNIPSFPHGPYHYILPLLPSIPGFKNLWWLNVKLNAYEQYIRMVTYTSIRTAYIYVMEFVSCYIYDSITIWYRRRTDRNRFYRSIPPSNHIHMHYLAT